MRLEGVEFGFDVGEGGFKGGTAVRVGGALREYVFALKLQFLAGTLLVGLFEALAMDPLVGVQRLGVFLGYLFFHGFAFPSSGHSSMVREMDG